MTVLLCFHTFGQGKGGKKEKDVYMKLPLFINVTKIILIQKSLETLSEGDFRKRGKKEWEKLTRDSETENPHTGTESDVEYQRSQKKGTWNEWRDTADI